MALLSKNHGIVHDDLSDYHSFKITLKNKVTMNESDKIAWLKLHLAQHISLRDKHRLLSRYKTASNIVQEETSALTKLGISALAIKSLKANTSVLDESLKWALQPKCHILPISALHYPALLKQISNPPILLFAKGLIQTLNQPQIAVIGTRNPTPTGRELAQEFAFSLTKRGLCITSGLAIGIDTAAHQGAMLNASGATIAALGSGLNNIYPKQNNALSQQIMRNGVIISEFPVSSPPKKAHFPQRNRLISGLSIGTLVVEATLKSGSLITARLAAEQNREVFAIPSSIRNPMCKGCHYLIKNGAKLVENIDDILEELIGSNPSIISTSTKPVDDLNFPKQDNVTKQGLDMQSQNLLDCFGFETISIDQLVARSNLSAAKVAAKLLILELEGYITPAAGGYIKAK